MRSWEKKEFLWGLVEKHQDDLLQICSELIQIPSVEWKGIEEILRFWTDLGFPIRFCVHGARFPVLWRN